MRRHTRGFTTVLAGAAVLALAPLGAPTATAVPAPTFTQATVVATFPTGPVGAFAESMASDGHGGLIVSVTTWGPEDDSPDGYAPNTGQLWRVKADGTRVTFGPRIRLSEYGQLMGVAVDAKGRVFVARWNFGAEFYGLESESPRSAVLRVTSTGVHRVMTLPLVAWPNGVEIHGRTMFVTDPLLGSLWKGPTLARSAPTAPWFTSDLLAPGDTGLGANGIAYRHGALYVTAYDHGAIVKVGVRGDGTPGKARVVAKDLRLITADGIAFDRHGRLWVAVNGTYDADYNPVDPPALVVVGRTGTVRAAATPTDSLDYPTDLVLAHHGAVLLANGSFVNGAPNVTVLTR